MASSFDHPSFVGWEEEGRLAADALDGAFAAIVLGEDPTAAAEVALGIGRAQARRRRVVIGDVVGELPPIEDLVPMDAPHGIVDSFLYGVSLNQVAHAIDPARNLYVLPSGAAPIDTDAILRSDRWGRLAGGFREVGALLLIVAPAGSAALGELLRVMDGLVLVGNLTVPSDVKVLAHVRARPAAPASARGASAVEAPLPGESRAAPAVPVPPPTSAVAVESAAAASVADPAGTFEPDAPMTIPPAAPPPAEPPPRALPEPPAPAVPRVLMPEPALVDEEPAAPMAAAAASNAAGDAADVAGPAGGPPGRTPGDAPEEWEELTSGVLRTVRPAGARAPWLVAGIIAAAIAAVVGVTWATRRYLPPDESPGARRAAPSVAPADTSAGAASAPTTPGAADTAARPDSSGTAAAAASLADPSGVPDSARAAAWSVQLVEFTSPTAANSRLEQDAARGLHALTIAATTRADGAPAYRVLSGAFQSQTDADTLLQSLHQRRLLPRGEGRVIYAPYAVQVQSGVSPENVSAYVSGYRNKGLSVYALLQRDGTATLYAGAFESPDEAGALMSKFRDGGVAPRVTYRTGRIP